MTSRSPENSLLEQLDLLIRQDFAEHFHDYMDEGELDEAVAARMERIASWLYRKWKREAGL